MELNQLEYFLTVARLQHVTRAAEALSITQPALSHSIAKLEEELGVQLFERSGRNVQLNRYGELFARRVERVVQEIDKGKQEIEELTNPESGVVSLAFLNVLGTRLIPSLVKEFKRERPNVRFELQQGTGTFIRSQLETGACDLIITSACSGDVSGAWTPFHTYRLDVVVPKGHAWSGRKEVELRELAEEPYIGLKNQCGLKTSIEEMLEKADVAPHALYEAEDLPTVAGFVSAGLGVSLLPRAEGLALEGVCWVPLRDPGNEFEVGIEWKEKRYLSPAAKAFREFVAGRRFASVV
ncbi:LysR family transcriptional regulator [Cohnella xylanilytica]|uniref:LysR family transcriptional regulator n=1 Tax=Cohnella xylanilytica TaxID=557555 RepID=A0A841TX24_9BACL|nr:LysR family transcriptional regulator [Cohnella xylanilytica]MBB6691548.1 LysR family transcriptional regulator [Cohnella xylanilytica]